MAVEQVLIAGEWRKATSHTTFTAENPATGKKLPVLNYDSGNNSHRSNTNPVTSERRPS